LRRAPRSPIPLPMSKPTLFVITVSTRQGRQGEPVARWAAERAEAHGGFEVERVDLRQEALPLFDEPRHPHLGRYEHEHTRRWSAKIARADAFVFVTPEYNHGMAPSLLNALTYLSAEWAYKPAAFVSYGGISGGTRSVHEARAVTSFLRMMPIPEGVPIPFFAKSIADGVFDGSAHEKAATAMLDELGRWTLALRTLRT